MLGGSELSSVSYDVASCGDTNDTDDDDDDDGGWDDEDNGCVGVR